MGTYVDKIPGDPLVQPWLNVLHGYADQSYLAAYKIADDIVRTNKILGSESGIFGEPNYTPPTVTDPDINLTDIDEPVIPELLRSEDLVHPGNIEVSKINHKSVSKPSSSISLPAINIPQLPTVIDPDVPQVPLIDLDKEFPDAIVVTKPDEPVLLPITIPDIPTINIPTFDVDVPVSDIVVPGNTFSFDETAYTDDLLTKVKDELLIRLSGGTGLNPVVEQAIWDRGRDREHVASQQAERDILVESARTGFTRPQGATRAALDRATQATQAKIIELSREIMIAQANLEQENIKTTIQQVIGLEDALLREHNNIQARAFAVAKYIQDVIIELYKASVTEYNLRLEAYKTQSVVFKALIDAELTKVEVFKAEIKGQALVSDINKQYIDMYAVTVDAIKTTVETYKVEVEAVSEQLRAEGIKIETYKAEVQAYSEIVSANAQKYLGYSETIKGEAVKADIYQSKVNAYASRIQAYATEQSAEDTATRIELETEELKIKQFSANLDGYIKGLQADQLNFQSQVDVYRGEASLYSSKAQFKTSGVDFELRQFESQIQQAQYSYDKALESARMNMANILAENELKLKGTASAGSIHSQIAASSLSAINVSASNSSSLGNSLSESY